MVFSLAVNGKTEKKRPQTIEHLLWADTPGKQVAFYRPVADVTVETSFTSDPIIAFHVPPSPKSEALFIETWAQSMLNWSDYEMRKAVGYVWYRLSSDSIPENIEVLSANVNMEIHETNASHNFDLGKRRFIRYNKEIMRRDNQGWWIVRDKDTGEEILGDQAIFILNTLMDNGFDAEAWIEVTVQGAVYVMYAYVWFQVSRV